MNLHLFDRVCWAHDNLAPVQTDLVIVWEDPREPETPARVTVPAPEWLAMALHGGLLPPVEQYHHEPRDENGTFVGSPEYWRAYVPLPAMTEEEALEYLLMKDVPRHVWDTPPESNRQHFVICHRARLPQSRRFRNSWRLA